VTDRKIIGDGSVGIQAGGDVAVQLGLAVSEVRELTELFLKENFPRLREDARATARSYVVEFADQFCSTLARRHLEIQADRFRDPDIQSTINDAVIETAKRGQRANLDILAELVVERLRSDGDEEGLASLACAEAVKVVPRLSRRQIDFLAVMLYLQYMTIQNVGNVQHFEFTAKAMLPVCRNMSGLSGWHAQYLEAVKCLVHLWIGGNDITLDLMQKYPAIGHMSSDDLKLLLKEQAPAFHEMADVYRAHRMHFSRLTLTGQMIAAIRVNQVMPGAADLSTLVK
jgi:hypothetical protein